MKRYLGIGLAWLGATVLSILIASAAVAGIRDRVVDAPVAAGAPTTTTTEVVPGTSTASTTTATTEPVAESSSTTSTSVVTTTAGPVTTTVTSTSEPAQPSTTTSPTASTTTTTTAPPTTSTTTIPPTTTTTTAPPTRIEYYKLTGGQVWLRVGSETVEVSSIKPNGDFSTEIDNWGPPTVEMAFVGINNDHRSELTAEIEDGELKVDIVEEGGDEEDSASD